MPPRLVQSNWNDRLSREALARSSRILPREFYARPTEQVARSLLGKLLVHGQCAGRIVEVEAYLPHHDLAAHSSRGLTPRTRVLFGPPGHAYVYFIYGMYECLNIVCEPPGTPGCVLIRALEPLLGLASMRRRRPAAARPEQLCAGPGRLTQALGISRRHYGADLTAGDLTIREFDAAPPVCLRVTPRIGIRACASWPLRFLDSTSGCLSRPA